MDKAAFRQYLLVERGMAHVTVQRLLGRLNFSQRQGFDLGLFATSHDAARKAGMAYLAHRAAAATKWAYNNDVQLLNNLAAALGYEGLRFRRRRPNMSPPKHLLPDQLRILQAYRHPNKVLNRLHRALIAVLRESGLRPSEAAKLRLDDLDALRSTIRVQHPAKRGLERLIPVPRRLWRPRGPLMAYLRHRSSPLEDPQALWVAEYGPRHRPDPHPITYNRLRWHLQQIGRRVGFRVNHTILRHTHGTNLYARFGDVLFVKWMLGHRHITSTMVYTHPTDEDFARRFHGRRNSKHGG